MKTNSTIIKSNLFKSGFVTLISDDSTEEEKLHAGGTPGPSTDTTTDGDLTGTDAASTDAAGTDGTDAGGTGGSGTDTGVDAAGDGAGTDTSAN